MKRLSDYESHFLDQYEAAEADRFEREAARREAQADGIDGVLRVAASRRRDAEANMADDRLPIVTVFDAAAVLKRAASADRTDAGLAHGARLLAARAAEDSEAVLSWSDLRSLRDHVLLTARQSRIGHVVAEAALASAPTQDRTASRKYFSRVASLAAQVTDQDSYNRVLRTNGLDGEDLTSMRTALLIRAFAQNPEALAESTVGATNLDLSSRIAQMVEEEFEDVGPAGIDKEVVAEDEEPLGDDMADEMLDDDMSLGEVSDEPGIPAHMEEGETGGETVSPNTGKPMVVELAEAAPVEALDEDNALAPMSDAGPFEIVGQLVDMLPVTDDGDMDVAAPESEVVVTVPDPTAPGKQVDIVLRPHESAPDEEMPGAMPAGGMAAEMPDEMPPEVESVEEDEEEELPPVQARRAKLQYRRAGKNTKAYTPFVVLAANEQDVVVVERFRARNIRAALTRVAAQTQLPTNVDVYLDMRTHKYARIDYPDVQFHVVAADHYDVSVCENPKPDGSHKVPKGDKILDDAKAKGPEKPEGGFPQKEAKVSLSRTAVLNRCATIGLTAAQIEARVLDGQVVEVGSWAIMMTPDSRIAMGRVGNAPRVLNMVDMDTQISQFQAAVAASLSDAYALRFNVTAKTAAERELVAKRAVNECAKVAKPVASSIDAQSGAVEVLFGGVPVQRAQARIARVLNDVFGIKRVTAAHSPFNGDTPAPRAQAGQPAAEGMKNSMPTAHTGTQAQADFIKEGTDPFEKRKPTVKAAGRKAQLAPAPENEMPESAPQPSTPVDPAALPAPEGAPGATTDASSPLNEEDENIVKSALTHYRVIGKMPLESLVDFSKDYADFLNKFGDADGSATPRAVAEANVIRILGEVWSGPANVEGGAPAQPQPKAAGKTAMPTPKINPRPNKAKQKLTNGDMFVGSEDEEVSGIADAPAPAKDGHVASRKQAQGWDDFSDDYMDDEDAVEPSEYNEDEDLGNPDLGIVEPRPAPWVQDPRYRAGARRNADVYDVKSKPSNPPQGGNSGHPDMGDGAETYQPHAMNVKPVAQPNKQHTKMTSGDLGEDTEGDEVSGIAAAPAPATDGHVKRKNAQAALSLEDKIREAERNIAEHKALMEEARASGDRFSGLAEAAHEQDMMHWQRIRRHLQHEQDMSVYSRHAQMRSDDEAALSLEDKIREAERNIAEHKALMEEARASGDRFSGLAEAAHEQDMMHWQRIRRHLQHEQDMSVYSRHAQMRSDDEKVEPNLTPKRYAPFLSGPDNDELSEFVYDDDEGDFYKRDFMDVYEDAGDIAQFDALRDEGPSAVSPLEADPRGYSVRNLDEMSSATYRPEDDAGALEQDEADDFIDLKDPGIWNFELNHQRQKRRKE